MKTKKHLLSLGLAALGTLASAQDTTTSGSLGLLMAGSP